MSQSKPDTLKVRTEAALRQRIEEGAFSAGEKLPTEKQLAVEFGVSRTVIREAIIGLRAEGLLRAKHGVGYFVEELKPVNQAVPTHFFADATRLDALEFRMAVEIYAAGLAASRKSWAQEAKIWEAAKEFERVLSAGEATEQSDWTFHRSISEATNNKAFTAFFDYLGVSVLPRRSLPKQSGEQHITREYLQRSIAEHKEICEAISSGDVERAKEAMQNHLGKSHMKYSALTDSSESQSAS
ncbi:TPA: FadR family transcriptional regulator [Klebsiella pneumoniae]|uniref:FadR/GntR family transcriptional regulator n=1 Tax=Klebsiella pneumoniae TaxID=573 RepID=UPI00236C11B7|nr:FadR family transcriptional regulator [Klebsiella pneumoniae]HCM3804530.1 FadR family transcriptional regulator [Klebsiella variicola subsp. variicola]ELP0881839.1 FadR family transcriptional regulator [Klebsiella pneumoniae]MCD9844424.1 FadR family transcriptional regulator [Klebsiella pneumoniae]UZL29860.1 FadR family transcriptional regulator [Klebsiella pneumoniae]